MSLILIDENIVDPVKHAIKIQIDVGSEGLQRSEQNRRHTQDAYLTSQGRSATVHRFDELLAAYIPHFADKVSPLRELLKKDVPFVWHEDHQRTYDDLNRCIGSESCLSYYRPQKETALEVDASQKGLGACLLQDNKRVEFARRRSHRHS